MFWDYTGCFVPAFPLVCNRIICVVPYRLIDFIFTFVLVYKTVLVYMIVVAYDCIGC